MKKSVIVVVAIIYIASILFVGFFGVEAYFDDLTYYATKIECINQERYDVKNELLIHIVKKEEENTTIIQILDFRQIYYEEAASLKVDWRVYPTDVSNKDIRITYPEDDRFYVDKENEAGIVQGTVHFTKFPAPNEPQRAILPKITLRSADGHGALTYVQIAYIVKNGSQEGGG